MTTSSQNDDVCAQIPSLLSSFVDTFVDFSVSGGLFLPPPTQNSDSVPLQTTYPSPPSRLIAIGDLHGDLPKTRQALKLSGLIDDQGRWSGGSTTLVQIGDVLDRGGDELKILYLLEKLKREASKVGGNVITMNGNHEIMNVDGDFRYVTKFGINEFVDWSYWYCIGNELKRLCYGFDKDEIKDPFEGVPFSFKGVKEEYWNGIRARIAALRPNGPISTRFLSNNVSVCVIGDSIFVHGGLLGNHVEYGLERINEEVREWINGMRGRFSPRYLRGKDSLVWLRKFSEELEARCDCSMLEHVLKTIPGAKRMIMGHTIQQFGINGVCNNRAIRIDVGMSKGCSNGLPEVLQIQNSELTILTSNLLYQNRYKSTSDLDQNKEGLGLLLPKQVELRKAGHNRILYSGGVKSRATEQEKRAGLIPLIAAKSFPMEHQKQIEACQE